MYTFTANPDPNKTIYLNMCDSHTTILIPLNESVDAKSFKIYNGSVIKP